MIKIVQSNGCYGDIRQIKESDSFCETGGV